MRPLKRPYEEKNIQQLLDEELQAEAELEQLDKNIEALERKVIGKDWWDGNFIVRWSRYLNDQKDHELNLHPKDKWFSISSVTSHPSGQLLEILNQLLDKNETNPKTDARKKFSMKPKKQKSQKTKLEERQKRQKMRGKLRRIRRPNKNKNGVNRIKQI